MRLRSDKKDEISIMNLITKKIFEGTCQRLFMYDSNSYTDTYTCMNVHTYMHNIHARDIYRDTFTHTLRETHIYTWSCIH